MSFAKKLISSLFIVVLILSANNVNCSRESHPFFNRINRLTIIFVVDSINKQSTDFLSHFADNADKLPEIPSIYCIFLNDISLKNKVDICEILDDSMINALSLNKNSYYVFNKDKKLIARGSLTGESGILIQNIWKSLDQVAYKANEEKNRIETLHSFIEAFAAKSIGQNINCFVFFEQICEGCDSGKSLIHFSTLQDKYKNISFNYVPLSEYSPEDISRINANIGLKNNVILSIHNISSWWLSHKNNTIGIHPLIGTYIAVDRSNNLIFIDRSIRNLELWLEALPNE